MTLPTPEAEWPSEFELPWLARYKNDILHGFDLTWDEMVTTFGGPVPVACREPPSLFCFEDLKNCPSLHHSLLRQNQLAKPFCSLFHPAKHRCISQSWWKMQVCGRSRRMQENTSDVCLWSNELEVHAQQLWNFFWAVPGQQTARCNCDQWLQHVRSACPNCYQWNRKECCRAAGVHWHCHCQAASDVKTFATRATASWRSRWEGATSSGNTDSKHGPRFSCAVFLREIVYDCFLARKHIRPSKEFKHLSYNRPQRHHM